MFVWIQKMASLLRSSQSIFIVIRNYKNENGNDIENVRANVKRNKKRNRSNDENGKIFDCEADIEYGCMKMCDV